MEKPKYQMQIRVHIQHMAQQGYGGLEISESVRLDAEDFLEISAILAKFHELAQALKSKRVA